MKFGHATIACGLILCLFSACGGGGSNHSTQPLAITTSTLADATVGVAYQQTLSASGGVPPLSWSISAGSLPAGLTMDNVGMISGTPTGTGGTASFAVAVSDSESPAAKATRNFSLKVNSSATSLLKGDYAFLFTGYFNGYFTGVGSFSADGAGNITNGLVDTNGLTGPTQNQFTGTYVIGANTLGTMQWTFTGPGGGSSTYAIALSQDGNARFIQYDSHGVQGSGVIKPQDSSAFSAGKIAGSYAFGLVGIDGSGGKRMALAGEFQSDGVSGFNAGITDINDNGAESADVPVTGTYSVASNGRGIAVLSVSGIGTVNVAFYIVNANELLVAETDTVASGHPLVDGDILQQTGAGSFSNSSLAGVSVLESDAANAAPGVTTVSLGLLNVTSPGTLSLSEDINSDGTLTANSQTLTYSVASNGRVTTTGTNPPTLYLVDQDHAFILFPDAVVSSGVIEAQAPGPLTDASLVNTYDGGTITLAASGFAEIDALSADGNGSLAETFNNSDGTHLQQGTRSLMYAVASNGRVTLTTAQGSDAGILYIISPTKAVEITNGNPSLSFFEH